ncbi:MAG: hypothetical protein FWH18_08670 [Marinilabiliaceae bacterium]|nr:hypothetical protein [Marinilabiliaceae bacterium]
MFIFILGILSSVIWALLFAILLWVLCFFVGKIVNVNYTMAILQHLVCFVIAIPTVIFLFLFFTSNKANKMVAKVETAVTNILIADTKFVDKLQQQIGKASKTGDTDDLTFYLADNFSEKIATENSTFKKYIDVDKISKNSDLSKHIYDLAKEGNVDKIIQATASSFTKDIKKKIKSIKRKMLLITIFLQIIPFGVVIYSASKYRNPVHSTYIPGDY